MPRLIDDLQNEAAAAVLRMKEAALAAREAHARAELLRHMITTARKFVARPRAEAVELVVSEWMKAWSLPRGEWPALEAEMTRYTQAVRDWTAKPEADADTALRAAAEALEAGFRREGSSLPDQMAWRSECAHGWWEAVRPAPPDLPGRSERPVMPRPAPGAPFWDTGCAPQCR